MTDVADAVPEHCLALNDNSLDVEKEQLIDICEQHYSDIQIRGWLLKENKRVAVVPIDKIP